MAAALLGAGAKYQVNISGSYTDIALCKSIDCPEIVADDVDVTVLLSANQFREWIAGFADGGQVTLELQYDHLQFATLYGLFRTPSAFRILFSDASKFDHNGYINSLKPQVPLDKEVMAPV